VGQEGYYGTGSFQILLNIKKLSELNEKTLDDEDDVDKLLNIDDPKDFCSKDKIKIESEFETNIKDSGFTPDDYNMDF